MTENTQGWSLTKCKVVALLGVLIASLAGFLWPIMSMLLSAWIAAVGGIVWYIRRRFERVYHTHWYNTAIHLTAEEENWPEIDALMDDEPLTHESSSRLPKMHVLRDLFLSLVLALFLVSTFVLIVPLRVGGDRPVEFGDWALGVGILASSARC